ncbi:fungal-specific transcription factor domain-containing protein [Aspergillus bertholletiae]|uniref:Fungal-specific transcription factor domain-containing protein n=1 Tax=Aspergillus bertholletiae TaxID=1226010 RepID=A0A5N7BE76_9EURO|nr:fungal-specific transcription factor domain-containing protein [Aspergillus bertholletiae]
MRTDHVSSGLDRPHKRRRIVKACDECRRLKIKCDGLTPCTHCVTYERTCTYTTPNRRPKSLAQHAQELEDRLQTIQRLLKAVDPSLDIDNPGQELASATSQATSSITNRNIASAAEGSDISIRPLRSLPSPPEDHLQQIRRRKPAVYLPDKDVAYGLLAQALEDACVLHRFVHEPSFYAMVDRIYHTPTERLTKNDGNSLALFYAALALGALFVDGMGDSCKTLTTASDKADRYSYCNLALKFLNIDEDQDLVSLQAICFLTIFFQSSGQLKRCYSYAGIALRSAVALGLHQYRRNILDPVEREIRKRVFWAVWRLDIYSSSMLGLPLMLRADLVDQSLPEPLDDTYATKITTTPAATENKLLLIGANAHTSLTLSMPKVMKHVKAFKKRVPRPSVDLRSLMKRTGMAQVEQELEAWLQNLPSELLPGARTTVQLERVRQLLRIAYAYVRMVLYEPVLQWMPRAREGSVDPQVLDYVVKYIAVARDIVGTGVLIHKGHIANYSSRSTMVSTTYSAILSLIVFLLNIPAPSGTKGVVFKEALEGRRTLEDLSSRSRIADRYVRKLNVILERFQDGPRQFPSSDSEFPGFSMIDAGTGRTDARTNTRRLPSIASEGALPCPDITTIPESSEELGLETSNEQLDEGNSSDMTSLADIALSNGIPAFDNPTYAFGGLTELVSLSLAVPDSDYRINQSDEPGSRPSQALNYSPIDMQDKPGHPFLVGADVATLWWPPMFTLGPEFPEYSSSVRSRPESMGLDFPSCFGRDQFEPL